MNGRINEGSYHSLLLLEEISKEEPLSQRDLSKRLGIALGLVNSYVKNMVSKGYVRVSTFPKNRYKYLLTPKGLTEKSRLTYQHLHYFTNLYTTARKDFRELFSKLENEGVKSILFCGVDEVAEIAYLSLKETGIELKGVMDDESHARNFFDKEVLPLPSAAERVKIGDCKIIITSIKKGRALRQELLSLGIKGSDIFFTGNSH